MTEREKIVKELIEKVSKAYRKQLEVASDTRTETYGIDVHLQNKKLPYEDYMFFASKRRELEKREKEERLLAYGMAMAREELFE